MKRRNFLSAVGSGVVAASAGSLPQGVLAATPAGNGPVKLGLLFSQSGAMANNESLLKDISLMTIDQLNAKGGVMGRKVEGVVVDPASDWPMYAQMSKQLILSVAFACFWAATCQVPARL